MQLCTNRNHPSKTYDRKVGTFKSLGGQNVGYRLVDKNNPGNIEYLEFGLDSIAKIQLINDTGNLKYWVDSLLHYDTETGFPLTPWFYEFPDNCTLKLDGAFLSFSIVSKIYTRIKQ